jgi:hypothetical protein
MTSGQTSWETGKPVVFPIPRQYDSNLLSDGAGRTDACMVGKAQQDW